MNFLLHRHLAERDLGSLEATAGAMLPDLWRMADRRLRARPGLATAGDAPLAQTLRGIEHHLRADREFHRGPHLARGQGLATEHFRAAAIEAPKIGLLAHPAWELCLDGALLRRHGLAQELSALRLTVPHLISPAAEQAADHHHFGSVDADSQAADRRRRFEKRMRELAAELEKGEWVAGYAHGEGLAARLNGMRRRLGLGPVGGASFGRLAAALDTLLEHADAELPKLLGQEASGLA